MSSAFVAFSESVGTAASGIDTLSEQTLVYPGQGKAADAFDAMFAAEKQALAQLSEWAHGTEAPAQEQVGYDGKLEMAPTKADLVDAKAKLAAGTMTEQEASDLTTEFKDARKDHDAATAGQEWDNVPTMPATNIPGSAAPTTAADAKPMDAQQSEGVPPDDEGADPDVHGAEDTPEPGESGGFTSPPPSAGAPEQARPASSPSLSDTAVSTETSADTMAPATGAGSGALSQPTQATPGGAPIQGTGGAPSAAFGPTGGASGALSQPPQGTRGSVPPQSPQQKREAQDRRDERDAVTDAGTGIAGTAAAGLLGAGMGAASSSVPTGTSGAGAPPVPPTVPPTNGAAAPGAGGMGGVGGGGVRPPNAAMGSGEQVSGNNVKPIYRAEISELERELDEILGVLTPDDKEPPK